MNQTISQQDRATVVQWLESFSQAVRLRDFAAGRALCSPEVLGFGTVTARAEGIDELESIQWRAVWGVTRGFHFDFSNLHCGGSAGVYWVAVPWSSIGLRDSHAPFERRGRATIILQTGAAGLVAVHTHLSLEPAGNAERAVPLRQRPTGTAS